VGCTAHVSGSRGAPCSPGRTLHALSNRAAAALQFAGLYRRGRVSGTAGQPHRRHRLDTASPSLLRRLCGMACWVQQVQVHLPVAIGGSPRGPPLRVEEILIAGLGSRLMHGSNSSPPVARCRKCVHACVCGYCFACLCMWLLLQCPPAITLPVYHARCRSCIRARLTPHTQSAHDNSFCTITQRAR